MNSVVGHTYLYNVIIIFIMIVFAFLIGTLSYYKAFKVNNRIIYAIEKFEGYNDHSQNEINRILGNLGYSSEHPKCKEEYKNMKLSRTGNEEKYKYCVYIDDENPTKGEIYNYGVLTYMSIDLPIIDRFSIPIFTKANRLHKFTNKAPIQV